MFTIGHKEIINFNEDGDIKKLQAIIEEKYEYFDNYIKVGGSHCYDYLRFGSAIHLLINNFGKNNEKLKDKLINLIVA